ncbi:hypothetical protein ScPMuIL_003953 [Solemya velum]
MFTTINNNSDNVLWRTPQPSDLMSHNGVEISGSKISIGSERDLDNLSSLRNMSQSTIASPEASGDQTTLGELRTIRPGSSQPPHHRHRSSRVEQELSYDWTPKDSQANQVGMDLTNTVTVEPDVEEITVPREVKFESPVRRLRKKEMFVEKPEPAQRELSDAYIESISRTPRYGSGKYRNYDEMLDNMEGEDPFQGTYTPSEKKHHHSHHHGHVSRKARRRLREKQKMSSSSIPLQNVSQDSQTKLIPGKPKTKKRLSIQTPLDSVDSNQSNATYTKIMHGNSNPSYEHDNSQHATDKFDRTSVNSNGTFTVSRSNSQSAVMHSNSEIPPTQISHSSGISRHLNKYTSHISQMRKEQNCTDREALAEFIRKNGIKQKECKYYIPSANSLLCKCGREVQWHQEKGLETRHSDTHTREETWNTKDHTDSIPCDSFGEIKFQGFGHDTENSPYIRMCPDTNLELIWDILTTYWKLPVPKLLISVTGGAQRFDLKPRIKTIFKRGLINAATSTGAWIITGGTATGVMEFVGEAVRDHILTAGNQDKNVVAIGVATWGIVANRVELDGDEDTGLFPAVYALEDVYVQAGKKDVPLDHNHTHFMLVDDGTENKFGKEISFRAELENFISSKVETGVAENQSVNVPVILLVVEGGVNTMKTVMETINRGMPVLVMEGSGRAADFIATGYRLSHSKKNDEVSDFPRDFDKIITEEAKTVFEWKPGDKVEEKVKQCVQWLTSALQNRKLLSVYNVNEEESKDLDRAILYALLKANRSNADAQLALALAWNRSDIARQEIFTTTNREQWKKLNLYHAMFTALVQDRVDFVQLFIDNGVDFKKFLTKETLWNMYANVGHYFIN